jgi:hypothetical protein
MTSFFGNMEDNFNLIKWKNYSLFGEREDDPNIFPNGIRPHFLEDGRQPQLIGK